MSFLVELIVAILKAFFPAIQKASKNSYTQAHPQNELKKRLEKSILQHWGKALILCFCFFSLGCFERTVYVPDGTPVKLREKVRHVKVWVRDKDKNIIPSVMDLPEGWFVLPDPEKID
jgi:hypothetical protein